MRLIVIASCALCALAGCTSEVDKAEQRYAIVEKSGDSAAVCAEGAKLAAAYLEAGDAEKYNQRKLSADVECTSRRQSEAMGEYRMPDGTTKKIEADNMDSLTNVDPS